MTVLLTDGQQRKTLVCTRSLGRKGIGVVVGEDTCWATSLYSKYCTEKVVYPNTRKEQEGYYHWLLRYLQQNKTDTVFPMDDLTTDILINYAKEIEKYCSLLLPDSEQYRVARDKGQTYQKATELGMAVPQTVYIGETDLRDLDRIGSRLYYPQIIKPRSSSGSRGITIVQSAADFKGLYEKVNKQYSLPVVQEFIPSGERNDVCLLYDHNGRLRASFVQKEIRHFPLERGTSTVQESVLRPDLVEKADLLMKSLNWRGIAEVEFMYDSRDGQDKLMEINPRFWGSLHLSVVSGVDFPWLYYCLATGREIEDVFEYRLGIFCRWSLPADTLHFLTNKERRQMKPSFFSFFTEDVYDDILSRDDPMPILGFIMATIHYLPDKEMWKTIFDR